MTTNSPCKDALRVFSGDPDPAAFDEKKFKISRINGGLINYSWLVEPATGKAFLLQHINKKVFHLPGAVQDNYMAVWSFARSGSAIRLPEPVFYTGNQTLFRDNNDNYWRAFDFIDGTHSPVIADGPSQARATALTFGRFTAALGKFDPSVLQEVIPGFHDLSYRYHQFEDALSLADPFRKEKANAVIEALQSRKIYKDFYEKVKSSPADYPKRVMHHDAKIANVLFDKQHGNVVCPVDFDTVMPGYFFSDLGDMIRSMACSADENCKDVSLVTLRSDYYNAIVEGYLEVMNEELTPAEKKHIHQAGTLMIYMQALRFLTDYLNGDIYYHIDYPEQNLHRATNQLALLTNLEEYLRRTLAKTETAYLPAK
jgi:Ser/Thr protein kinase RdoA (MazF antagonist)